jgi:hypothetical protein
MSSCRVIETAEGLSNTTHYRWKTLLILADRRKSTISLRTRLIFDLIVTVEGRSFFSLYVRSVRIHWKEVNFQRPLSPSPSWLTEISLSRYTPPCNASIICCKSNTTRQVIKLLYYPVELENGRETDVSDQQGKLIRGMRPVQLRATGG